MFFSVNFTGRITALQYKLLNVENTISGYSINKMLCSDLFILSYLDIKYLAEMSPIFYFMCFDIDTAHL